MGYGLLWILNMLQASPLLQKLSIMVSEHVKTNVLLFIFIMYGYCFDFDLGSVNKFTLLTVTYNSTGHPYIQN